MQILTPQTHEFLYPGKIPSEWLQVATKLWNDGLKLLEWRQQSVWRQKCLEPEVAQHWGEWQLTNIEIASHRNTGKNSKFPVCWGFACRLGRDRRIDKTKSWDEGNLEFLPVYSLVPGHWLNDPPIDNYSDYALKAQFTKKAGYDYTPLPSGLMQSLCKRLCDSWKQYQKGLRGKPKYRGAKNPVTSLDYDGFRNCCRLSQTGKVKLLGMPEVFVPGIVQGLLPKLRATAAYLRENPTDKMLEQMAKGMSLEEAAGFYATPGSYCLLERNGQTYLQLSGMFVATVKEPRPEVADLYTGTDALWQIGTTTIAHACCQKLQRKVETLHRILATKKYKSRRWQLLKDKIARLQRRAKFRVRRHQQYHAHWLASRYGRIEIRSYVPPVQPAPVPRPDHKGNYLPNGATQIAERNQQRSRVAIGQFIQLIKEQSQKTGTQVIDFCKELGEDSESPVTPPPQTLNSANNPNGAAEQSDHAQEKSRQGRKPKGNSQIPQNAGPRKPRGRNRRREKAIG